jgi:hypothetical protein
MIRIPTLIALAVILVGCAGERSGGETREEAPVQTATDKLQADKVPPNLRHLIPLAERWGIGDDVDRAELGERATAADRQALVEATAPHQEAITAWLDSFGTRPLTDEAAAFMYMQLAIEEMDG